LYYNKIETEVPVSRTYGAELPVIDWVIRLKCLQCGSRSVDFVLTGARR